MATAAKTAAVAEIRDAFTNSTAAVLTEYRGLTVAQLRELRRTLAGNATYAVVKNTLTKIAASDAGIPGFDALLQGPSAIAFVSGDPVTVAKGIRDFSRTNPLLVIKGGVLDGRAMSADEIRRLADVESREVLLARLAGGLLASLSGAVSLIAAPLSQAARLLAALQARAAADPGVLRGDGDTTPAGGSGPATPGDEPPADDAAAGELAAESPAPAPAPTDATPEPATSGDAADAAVAADALAREVAAEDVAAEDVTVEQPPAEQPPDEEPPA